MPCIKPFKTICIERAIDDCEFYYSEFRNYLLEEIKKDNNPEAKQHLVRLDRWLLSYRSFAEKFHKNNYVAWNDIFVNPDDAGDQVTTEKPRAPYLGVFDEFDET